MQREISKLCADSLRALASEKYGTKLKSAHAHELVAAYFGYQSKNVLLADNKHPIGDLAQASLLVTMSDEFFNKRRANLHELPAALPTNSDLYQAIHGTLVANKLVMGPFPPFADFEALAISLLRRSPQYDAAFPFHHEFPLDHFVTVVSEEDPVLLIVAHAYAPKSREDLVEGYTEVFLPRVAGRIGYGAPKLMPTKMSGGARITLNSMGVRP